MNKKLIILLASTFLLTIPVFLSSCVDEPNVKREKKIYQFGDGDELCEIEVVTKDGCEYLYGPWGNATVLTHKGNCKNQIHYK